MFEDFLTAAYLPFSIAFCVMVGVGLIEAIGLGLGSVDIHADHDATGANTALLDWIGLTNGVPVLVWLTSLLGCFTLSGLTIQQISTASVGEPQHWAIAAMAALLVGAHLNRVAVGGLARLFPAFESTVISTDDLLMRRGVILEGVSQRGHPARARVVDQHKQAHYVMVEPHYDHDRIATGATVLLISKQGAIFLGLPDDNAPLKSL